MNFARYVVTGRNESRYYVADESMTFRDTVMPQYRDHAIALINDYAVDAANYYDERVPLAPEYGVDGRTFRAYRDCNEAPSVIFRAWAEQFGFARECESN